MNINSYLSSPLRNQMVYIKPMDRMSRRMLERYIKTLQCNNEIILDMVMNSIDGLESVKTEENKDQIDKIISSLVEQSKKCITKV